MVLLHLPDSGRDEPQGRVEYHGLDEAAFAARRRDGLLLNIANSLTAPHRDGLRAHRAASTSTPARSSSGRASGTWASAATTRISPSA